MELTTLWFCMTAAFLMVGVVAWLRPDWFLACAWTLHPHHITPETIAHLHGDFDWAEAKGDAKAERCLPQHDVAR